MSAWDQLTLDNAIAGARNTDPHTSHLAAVHAISGKADNQRRALTALYQAGDNGLTDFELADATGLQQTSIGKRRGELRDLGLVCKASDADGRILVRPAPSGKSAIVWRLTAAGLITAETQS